MLSNRITSHFNIFNPIHKEGVMVRIFVLSIISISCVLAASCKFSTANIAETAFATAVDENKKPIDRVTSFNRHHPMLHCCVLMANTPSETKVKAIWFYYPEGKPVQVIDSAVIAVDSDSWIDFNLTPAGKGLPYGKYSVSLHVNDKHDRDLPFTINPMLTQGVVREAALATGVTNEFFPTELASEFATDAQRIYAAVFVEDAPEGTVVSASWHMGESGTPMEDIGMQDYPCSGSGWVGFYIQPNNSLQAGSYFVDIYENGEKKTSLPFTMQ